MIGFLTGVAVNIVAGQIPDLTGAESEGRFAIAKAFNVLIHPSTIHLCRCWSASRPSRSSWSLDELAWPPSPRSSH